jgi:hypothetical protein
MAVKNVGPYKTRCAYNIERGPRAACLIATIGTTTPKAKRRYAMQPITEQAITIAAVVVLLINGACILLAGYSQDYWFYAMFGIAGTGLVTFFGIIIQDLLCDRDKRVSSRTMRLAITGFVVTTYIIILTYCLFLPEKLT